MISLKRKSIPFIAIYALVFGALIIMETLITSLVLQKQGAEQLPLYYGISALGTFFFVKIYNQVAHQYCVRITLQVMLAISTVFFGLGFLSLNLGWDVSFAALFIVREISFIMILIHFPSFAQSYFSIEEYQTISTPLLAGGRLGAVIGSFILEGWIRAWGIGFAPALYLIALVVAIFFLNRFGCYKYQYPANDGKKEKAVTLIKESPLFFHLITTGFIFILARWFMNYQYNSLFEKSFTSSEDLVFFLNRYSQISIAILTFLQFFFIGKFIKWFGLGRSFILYGTLFLGGSFLLVFQPSLITATIARFIENELRSAFRNPLYQNLTALFSGAQRIVVRSFLQGIVNPLGMITSTSLLRFAPIFNSLTHCAEVCVVFSSAYLVGSYKLVKTLDRNGVTEKK